VVEEAGQRRGLVEGGDDDRDERLDGPEPRMLARGVRGSPTLDAPMTLLPSTREGPVALVAPEQAPVLARPFYAAGPPGPLVASLAQVPELLEVAMPFVGGVLGPSALDVRTKEIVVLRVAALLECCYCVGSHTPIALDSGLSHAEVGALRGELSIDEGFADPLDRALVAFVEEVAAGRGPVDVGPRDLVRRALGEPTLVEITMVASATAMLARYCTTLELPTAAATLVRLEHEGFAAR